LAKNGSFGFLDFAYVSVKTKCAICVVALFSHETQQLDKPHPTINRDVVYIHYVFSLQVTIFKIYILLLLAIVMLVAYKHFIKHLNSHND